MVQVVTHFGLQVGNRGSIPLGLTPGRVNLVIARGDKPRALALGAGINISPQARGRILEKTPFIVVLNLVIVNGKYGRLPPVSE